VRRAAGLILLVVAVYTLGVWQGRHWGNEPVTAPPSIQTPIAGPDPTCRYYQDLIAWRETDKLVKRRGIETFCR